MSAREYQFSLVMPEHLEFFWPVICGWIEAALERAAVDTPGLDVVAERVKGGRYLLLLGADAGQVEVVGVLERVNAKRKAYIGIIALGGRTGRALRGIGPEYWQVVRNIAKAEGMSGVRVVGRPGWLRWCAAQPGGAKLKQVLIESGV